QELARREPVVEERPVRHEAETRLGDAWFALEIRARDLDPALVGGEQPRGAAQRRRLAGAVGAEEAHDLARAHLERQRAHRGHRAEAAGERVDDERPRARLGHAERAFANAGRLWS